MAKADTESGARTHDHRIKSPALYRLSYPGWLQGVVNCLQIGAAFCYMYMFSSASRNGPNTGSEKHYLYLIAISAETRRAQLLLDHPSVYLYAVSEQPASKLQVSAPPEELHITGPFSHTASPQPS